MTTPDTSPQAVAELVKIHTIAAGYARTKGLATDAKYHTQTAITLLALAAENARLREVVRPRMAYQDAIDYLRLRERELAALEDDGGSAGYSLAADMVERLPPDAALHPTPQADNPEQEGRDEQDEL